MSIVIIRKYKARSQGKWTTSGWQNFQQLAIRGIVTLVNLRRQERIDFLIGFQFHFFLIPKSGSLFSVWERHGVF